MNPTDGPFAHSILQLVLRIKSPCEDNRPSTLVILRDHFLQAFLVLYLVLMGLSSSYFAQFPSFFGLGLFDLAFHPVGTAGP